MTDKLYVVTHSHSEVTRQATETEWDRDDTYTSWSIRGVYANLPRGEWGDEVPIDFEVKPGDMVYLLYAIYSTGDSFGHDDRACFEPVLIFKDREKAVAAQRLIESHEERSSRWYKGDDPIPFDKQFNLTLKTESGIDYHLHVPWAGYFESLDEVEVEGFIVDIRK